jgi:hypothetical protein
LRPSTKMETDTSAGKNKKKKMLEHLSLADSYRVVKIIETHFFNACHIPHADFIERWMVGYDLLC